MVNSHEIVPVETFFRAGAATGALRKEPPIRMPVRIINVERAPVYNTDQTISACRKMSASTAVAGVIVFLLGLVGLLQLYGRALLPVDLAVVSVYLTTDGALLLFAALTLLGIGLIVGGVATIGESERAAPLTEKEKDVVVMQPGPSAVVYNALSDFELSVLRFLSNGKSEEEIASATGVDKPIIAQKIAKLRDLGYITDTNKLTEKGYEALRLQDAGQVYVKPAA